MTTELARREWPAAAGEPVHRRIQFACPARPCIRHNNTINSNGGIAVSAVPVNIAAYAPNKPYVGVSASTAAPENPLRNFPSSAYVDDNIAYCVAVYPRLVRLDM